ncbi:MAG: 5'-nucleotidase [Verrucomicrobia bacterium]|nr:5'-nucleotidase [Verrucomicrobiota bacterium]
MTTPARKFIFGVDLDGVVVDFYGALKPIAAEYFGKKTDELPDTFSYGLPEWGLLDRKAGYDLSYDALHKHAVNQHELLRTAPAIPQAAYTLRRLSRLGVHIRIITHRLYVGGLHNKSVTQTADWLEAHDVPYRDLCFVEDKLSINADLYIDDAPKNILAYRADGRRCIVFDNPTNRALGNDLRARNWDEVHDLVAAAMTDKG